MKNRITPEKIESLGPNEIFVFGSNDKGVHGAGAAKTANTLFGARFGVASGITGQCYAIATRIYHKDKSRWDKSRFEPRALSYVNTDIQAFIKYAIEHPDLDFLVTKLGCGNAGFDPEEIAPLFYDAVTIENIHLPKQFWDILMMNSYWIKEAYGVI